MILTEAVQAINKRMSTMTSDQKEGVRQEAAFYLWVDKLIYTPIETVQRLQEELPRQVAKLSISRRRRSRSRG